MNVKLDSLFFVCKGRPTATLESESRRLGWDVFKRTRPHRKCTFFKLAKNSNERKTFEQKKEPCVNKMPKVDAARQACGRSCSGTDLHEAFGVGGSARLPGARRS